MICTPNTGHLVWGYFYALDLLSQVKKLAQHSNSIFAICNSQLLPTNQICGLLSYPKKTKNPNPSPIGNRFGFFLFGGRGWITQAAHLKRPRRGLFAAGTYSGGRCCSNPPLRRFTNFQIKQKLQCHYNTGVLGGRGWITQAAHLKRPRRGLFAAGTYSGGRCCSNPPLRRFTNFQIKQKLQCHYNTGVLGGAKQPKSEPLPSGASLAAISSKVMVFVPSL